MADMELIIKIPEEMYQSIKQTSRFISGRGSGKSFDYILFNAVNNGTPLPKGHGRLIDADYLIDISLVHNFHANNKYFVPYKDRKGYRLRDTEVRDAIINAETIIEADKAESGDEK